MNDQKAKADGGKTQPGLLQRDMAAALYLVQRVLDYGLLKYERMSWQKVEKDRWDEACRRHQQAIDLGEEFDDESGLPHRAHLIAGQIIILMHEHGLEGDVSLKELGTFKEPPQDHKNPAPLGGLTVTDIDNGVVPVSIAKVGDKVRWNPDEIAGVSEEYTRHDVLITRMDRFMIWDDREYQWRKSRFL